MTGCKPSFQPNASNNFGCGDIFVIWLLYFQGNLLPNNEFRQKRILDAFKQAKLKALFTVSNLEIPSTSSSGDRLFCRTKPFWSRCFFHRTSPVLTGYIFCSRSTHAYACRRNYILGNIISGKRRANGRFWIRTA